MSEQDLRHRIPKMLNTNISNTVSSTYKDVICHSVENKYDGLGNQEIREIVARLWSQSESLATEDQLRALIESPVTPVQDIQNQIATALLISRYWARFKNPSIIWNVHSSIYARESDGREFRSSNSVADFDDVLSVAPSDVRGSIMELERFISAFVFQLRNANLQIQSSFLAYVFSSIIRIHAYPDGNGRTARFVVQYCLEVWGRTPVVIPKVRNSPKWKAALDAALKGNLQLLTDWFRGSILSS